MALFRRKPVSSAAPSPKTVVEVSPNPASSAGDLEARILEVGTDLLTRARGHKAGIFSKQFYSDALMEWSMKDPAFKVQMFRFVDTFPMLKSAEAIHDHLDDYLSQPGVTVPGVISAALKAGKLLKSASAAVIGKQITGMASKFIAGTDAASALPGLRALWNDGIGFSVDLLGEACVSDAEADQYRDRYLDLIRNLPAQVASWPANPRLESDHLGAIPRVNVSVKISSLSARCDPIDTDGSIRDLMRRLEPILETARDGGVFVNFDMEQAALKDLTLELFMRCVERLGAGTGAANVGKPFHAGLAMQAYLKSGVEDARRVCDWARAKSQVVTVRLVKGAYWDYETINAEMRGWPCPVWPVKWQTDECFERMSRVFLDASPGSGNPAGVKLALGSHNARSIAAALAYAESRGLPPAAVELQMLHGMADQLKHAGVERGLRIREYVPVGEMIPGMAYLVRRLLENTSNESWLKAGFLDNADTGALLARPHAAKGADAAKPDLLSIAPERHALSAAVAAVGDGRAFVNEPFRDFSHRPVREAFAAAVAGATVPRVANDTTVERAGRMVGDAGAAFGAWRDAEPERRARVLVRAAALMRQQRDGLAGVMIKESGKTWREADADVCEAIDFCEFYARCAVPMFRRERMGRFIGELDEQWYQARGVAVVIAPWNFPLAICTGMTVAALVTGNTVIVKPAEQTPGIAKVMHDILIEAMEAEGFSPDESSRVLQFCPAPGETTGAALVRDPGVAVIAFTGSRDVGLDILHAASPPSPFESAAARAAVGSLGHVKKVVCEMGGKNAVVIDTSADLDEAVLAVRHSAFGFQGQKCSACSRVIVVDPAGEEGPAIRAFVRRFVEATRSLTVGDPTLPGTDVGPVIDAEAKEKIERYVATAQKEGCRLELAVPAPAGQPPIAHRTSPFVGPHIFSGVKPTHTLAREEVFGPLVAVMHAATFGDALAIATGSAYRLTGGVFTRKPAHIERAKREFRVGNLYINRGITGALVARQPFGGFGMSGVGSKAGGRDYLLQFVEPRACAENTLRRGFAPEL
ncbi:MAG: proline dehydrogenase family protein [Phycisphaerales bacterium]